MKKIKRKLKNFLLKPLKIKISEDDIKSYKIILKIIYHKDSEAPITEIKGQNVRYFISNPKLKIHLIIDNSKIEIINTHKIWKLELDDIIISKALFKIQKIKQKQIDDLEKNIKDKKQNILDELYKYIK